jgi:enolase
MSRIQGVRARQVLDSRGCPTVEVEVDTSDGRYSAIVPSSISPGPYDARELRDGDKKLYEGKSVLKAVESINAEIQEAIIGMDPTDQEGIDQALIALDGSENGKKERLGANAIAGVSMAVCRAGAAKKGIPLYKHINSLAGSPTILVPVPSFSMINGGHFAGNGLVMREFCIMPTGAESFAEALQIGVEVYQTVRHVLTKTFGQEATSVGDEGGFVPAIKDNEEALKFITEAVKAAGYEDHVQIALGVSAGHFYVPEEHKYDLAYKRRGGPTAPGGVHMSEAEMLRMYKLFAANFGVVSIEDPFQHEDAGSYSKMTGELGEVVQIVGADFLCGDHGRVEMAIEQNACNAIELKINQVGTVSEVIAANNLARNAGMGVVVGHQIGDSEDAFIADLAVGLGTGQIKAGAPCRSERIAKYNQLLRIEQDLGAEASFAGDYWRDPWMMTPVRGKKTY